MTRLHSDFHITSADWCPACTASLPRMMPGQEPYTPAELATLYATVAAAADSDPGETNEPGYSRTDPNYDSTAAELAGRLVADATAASIEAETQRQAHNAARDAAYAAENASAAAAELAKAKRAQLADLVRALANRDEREPVSPDPDQSHYPSDTRATTYRATFGGVRVHESTGWGTRHAPRATAYAFDLTTDPARASNSRTLYESAKGSNADAKRAAELDSANVAARAWIADRTAAAYLIARGIDPDTAPDPIALARAVPELTRGWYGNVPYWTDRWTLTVAGVTIADRLPDTRDLPADLVADLRAVTHSDRPVNEPEPAEDGTPAGIAKMRAELAALAPRVTAAWMARYRRSWSPAP